MPGIEDSLRTALLADEAVYGLIAERCYAGTVPPHTTPTPWVYFTVPNEEPAEDLKGNQADRWEVEFELFAETYTALRALKRAVRAALNRYRGGQVRRCLWQGGDYTPVEGGHNWTDRYQVWGSDPTIVPAPNTQARIITGDGRIDLQPTQSSSPSVWIDEDGVIHGDGSGLTNVSAAVDQFTAENKDSVTIPAGMVLTGHTSGVGFRRASTADTAGLVGVLIEETAANFSGPVQTGGPLTLPDWTAATGAPSLAPRATYFVGDTPGTLTTSAPTAGAKLLQVVGVAVGPQTLDLRPSFPVLL